MFVKSGAYKIDAVSAFCEPDVFLFTEEINIFFLPSDCRKKSVVVELLLFKEAVYRISHCRSGYPYSREKSDSESYYSHYGEKSSEGTAYLAQRVFYYSTSHDITIL